MQVAAKRTAEREAKPASTDTTPSAQPTEAAADVEGVSTEPDDHLLRIGSDFAMAFVYSGTGKATRRVAWLGRVRGEASPQGGIPLATFARARPPALRAHSTRPAAARAHLRYSLALSLHSTHPLSCSFSGRSQCELSNEVR